MNELDNPYEQFEQDQLILRDQLAIDRTILANERTFLAYVRTSMAAAAVGVSLFKFFDSFWADVAGILFVVSAPIFMGIGIHRTRQIKRNIRITQGFPIGGSKSLKAPPKPRTK